MQNLVSTLVFFDLETGGPDPKRHPIIQIGALAVDADTLALLEEFECKVQFDERKATKFALRKNSYSRGAWLEQAIPEREAATSFADFLRRHASFPAIGQDGRRFSLAQLVAHNAPYDAAFLQKWYDRVKIFCPARHL